MGVAFSRRRFNGVRYVVREHRSNILIVGGPDVDSRIPLMQHLDDFQITAVGSGDDLKKRFAQAGFQYFHYSLYRGVNPLIDLFTLWRLVRLFRLLRPHIVHTFDTKPCVWGRLAARLAGVPNIIGTLPGLGSLYSRNDLRTRLIRKIYEPLQKLACHFSDLTIFQNPEDVELFINKGITSKHKTSVIAGSGVDTLHFNPQRFIADQQHTRISLGLSDSCLVITMVSRLIKSKGLLEFAQAAQSIQEKHSNIVFLLIGSEDNENMDALSSDEYDLIRKSVICLGMRHDIPELLTISGIFVLPTYYREGIPRVLLEAAAMGLPIIATQVPGCTEVVKDNLNGFLVPVHDNFALEKAMEKLISNPSLRKRFGQESRRLAVSQFDISIVTEQTASIYKKLLTQAKNGN